MLVYQRVAWTPSSEGMEHDHWWAIHSHQSSAAGIFERLDPWARLPQPPGQTQGTEIFLKKEQVSLSCETLYLIDISI